MTMIFDGSNGLTMQTWTTTSRPASPVIGQTGFNTTYGGQEVYNGSSWTLINGGPAFSYYQSSATSIPNATNTKILFVNKSFDTNNNFASSRFTPTVPGYYQITASVGIQIAGASYGMIYVNGSQVAWAYGNGISGYLDSTPILTKLIYLNGSTDYVEIYAFQNSGSTASTDTNPAGTWFQGSFVRGV